MICFTSDNRHEIRFHQPVEVVALKATSGISVKASIQIDERKTRKTIMNEIKNMLDYEVGHYVQGRTNKTVRPYFYKYFFKYVSLRTNVINIGYSYLDLSFKSV